METHPIFDPLALHRDKDYYYEFIKDGQALGDDGNWAFKIVGNNFVKYVKVSGNWKKVWEDTPPS